MLEGTAGETVNNRCSGAGGGGAAGEAVATRVALLEGTAGETVNNRSSGAGGDSWGGC